MKRAYGASNLSKSSTHP